MTTTFERATELYAQECITCGITFAIPTSYDQRLRQTHANFFCPNGHSQCYTGKTEAEKLRDELVATRSRLDQARAWAQDEEYRRIEAERRVAAHKGVVTKLRKRVAKGVCPCCHARFKDLREHMAKSHPDWNPEQGAEAIAAKAK